MVFEKEELEFFVFLGRPRNRLIEEVANLKQEISELESDLPKVGNKATISLIEDRIGLQKHYVYQMEGAIQIQEKYPNVTSMGLKRAMKEQRLKEARARREARLKKNEELNRKGKDKK